MNTAPKRATCYQLADRYGLYSGPATDLPSGLAKHRPGAVAWSHHPFDQRLKRMQFIKDNTENAHLITGIDSGAIRVDEDVITESVILSASTLVSWPVSQVNEINAKHWQAVMETQPEIILLGTGRTLIFPEPQQLQAAYDRQIGVEVMDTEAACRTYNLLVHERRKVTAALII